jgi:hypothetical protein
MDEQAPTTKAEMREQLRTMQLQQLREALLWYADPVNYAFREQLADGSYERAILIDGGDRARRLLGALVRPCRPRAPPAVPRARGRAAREAGR